MAGVKLTILILLLCVACSNIKKTFILDPSLTYPAERNVAVAVPIIPVKIEIIE